MKAHKYILRDRQAIEEPDLMVWAKWYESANRHVANTVVGKVRVSTVFLGLNHSFGSGPPLLFETMVFGGELDGEMDRYSTWEQAERGHQEMLARVMKETN